MSIIASHRQMYPFAMKHYYVMYTPQWQSSPMSFWVHRARDGQPWYCATQFDPPLPSIVPGKGYPHYYVEVDGFVWEFASLAELDVCMTTLAQKMLPSTDCETQARGTGPGAHWLNKLPAFVRPWRYRVKALRYLQRARDAFARAQHAEHRQNKQKF